MCDRCGCRDLTPVAKLMDEHDRLRELSHQIRRALAAGDGAARRRFDELLAVLGPHLAREEGALFPLLQRDDAVAARVTELAAEHATLYDAVDDLEDRPPDATLGLFPGWADAVVDVLVHLDQHMFKEDFGLFPAALASLEWADWDAGGPLAGRPHAGGHG